jgi:putative ABC transport system permease protein
MFSLHRTLSLRYLRQRWSRAVLIIVSIALGVATLVATRLLNQSLTEAAHSAVNPLAGTTDLMVVNGDAGVPLRLARELTEARIEGLAEVRPLVIGRVALVDLDYRLVWLLGVEQDQNQAQTNPYGIDKKPRTTWRALAAVVFGTNRAAVSDGLARELDANTKGKADRIRVRAAGKEHLLSGVMTLTLQEKSPAGAVFGANFLVLSVEDAARLEFPGRPEFVSRIDLKRAPGADLERVRAAVAAYVGDRGDVTTPEVNAQAVQDVTAGLELGFALGGVGALVVGLFLVYNALAVSVTERRHDIGILRSVGATRRQVAGLFATEAGFLGLIGSLVGMPAGVGLAYVALGPVQKVMSDIFMPIDTQELHIRPGILISAALAGLGTALLAALVPAVQAASEEPADAVRRAPRTGRWLLLFLQGAASGLFLAAGLACIAFRDYLPARYGAFGGVALLLIGGLVAMPLLTAIASHLLKPVIRSLFGIEGRLAADNLARSPGRTGLVVGALAAGAALLVQTAGVVLSSEHAILEWIDQRIAADLFVTAGGPLTAGGQMLTMNDEVGERLAADPEIRDRIEKVVPIRFHQTNFRERIVFVIAFDMQAAYETLRHRRYGEDVELYRRLAQEPDTAIVSDNFAALYHVKPGDTLELRGSYGPAPLRVLGSLPDYTWNRGTILVNRAWFRERFGDPLVDLFHVYLRPGEDVKAVRDIITRKFGAKDSLATMTKAELRDDISNLLRRLYGLAYAQEIVIGLVAALGVVTALLISVLQRRRELGLLRAVGASRAQVLRSVLAEALLMGAIGGALGLLLGIPLEWYVVKFLLLDEAGFVLPLQIPWLAAGVVIGMAILTATLAGLGPALHAMHLRIAEAIAYE